MNCKNVCRWIYQDSFSTETWKISETISFNRHISFDYRERYNLDLIVKAEKVCWIKNKWNDDSNQYKNEMKSFDFFEKD